MSQRKFSFVQGKPGGVALAASVARELGIHLLQLTDDRGDVLLAASRHPFKVIV